MEPLQAGNRDGVRLFAQVRTDEPFHFLNSSSANSSWFMQAFLSNFLYSRRTEAIYAQGRTLCSSSGMRRRNSWPSFMNSELNRSCPTE